MELVVYRNTPGYVVERIHADKETLYHQKFFGENRITVKTYSTSVLNITVGDWIRHNSLKYYLNTLPDIEKLSTSAFNYTMEFESEYYQLAKVQYLFYGMSDFCLMGNLDTFVDLVVTNLDRIYGESIWTKGTTDQTNADYKNLHFSAENCLSVLQRLCDEFDGEFYFNRRAINFTDEVGNDTGFTFQYKSGLRGIERKTVTNKNIVTRLYAFGSTQNIDSSYRSGAPRLLFENDEVNYLEKNTATYGTIEHTIIFEDIFPHRDGTLSAVDGADVTKFSDSAIDFDVNDYLISGVTAKVNFTTGNLAGYTFEVSDFDNDTKEFTIIAETDKQGLELPNNTLKPAVSDTYVLVDIKMPTGYITTAETALEAAAQAYLDANSAPRVEYNITPDPRYFKSHLICLHVGDKVTIADTDLGVNASLRIVELTQSLMNQYEYQIKLAEHPNIQLVQRLYDADLSKQNRLDIDGAGKINVARSNWRTSQELKNMIFDPDGYFTEHIKPLSIETTLLDVGAKSGNFILKEVQFQPNLAGDNNKLHITAGELVHLSVDNNDHDTIGTWTLVENATYDAGGLTTGTAYYLYAKCHKTDYSDAGNQIVVDSTQKSVDQGTYWYFLVGVLHSTAGSVARGISLTYGQTLISGKFITTGKIQSANTNSYFDLDNNTIVLASGAGTIAGTNITSIENGADVTGSHTAAAITGQGALATLSTVETAQLGSTVIVGGYIKTGLVSADNINTGTLVVARTEAKCTNALADQTSANTAAAITGQGALATLSTVGATNCDTTIIDGGKVITGLLTADNIQAGTLTGRTVQTASSGQRIVVSHADNTIRFHTATAVNVIVIDDAVYGSAPGITLTDATNGSVTQCVKDETNYAIHSHRGCGIYMNEAISGMLRPLYVDDYYATGPQVVVSLRRMNVDTLQIRSDGILTAGGVINANAGVSVTGNITVTGTVDGVDVAAHAGAGGAVHADVIAAGEDGFMTGTDKTKLDGIATGADVTGSNPPQAHTHTHASTTGQTANDHHNRLHSITNASDHSGTGTNKIICTDGTTAIVEVSKATGFNLATGTTAGTVALGDHNHSGVYAVAAHVGAGGAAHADVIAAGEDGFMTGTDKTKLDGIATGADVTGSNPPQTHNHAATAITSGNFNVARLPVGGTWTVTSDIVMSGAYDFDLAGNLSLVVGKKIEFEGAGSDSYCIFTNEGANPRLEFYINGTREFYINSAGGH